MRAYTFFQVRHKAKAGDTYPGGWIVRATTRLYHDFQSEGRGAPLQEEVGDRCFPDSCMVGEEVLKHALYRWFRGMLSGAVLDPIAHRYGDLAAALLFTTDAHTGEYKIYDLPNLILAVVPGDELGAAIAAQQKVNEEQRVQDAEVCRRADAQFMSGANSFHRPGTPSISEEVHQESIETVKEE